MGKYEGGFDLEPVQYLETGTNGFITDGSGGGPWGHRRGCSVNSHGQRVHGASARPTPHPNKSL